MNHKKQNQKTICIIRHSYFPGCTRITKEMNALSETGYSIDLVCLSRPGEQRRETINGVRVFRLPHGHKRGSPVRYMFEYGLSFVLMSAMISALYFQRRYSCIQVNTLPDFLVFVTFIPRLFGAKVLLDMHEPTPELWNSKYVKTSRPLVIKLLTAMEQLAIKYSNKVITVNDMIRSIYIERGARADKVAVIGNVPDEIFDEVTKKDSSENNFTLLTHGTIEERYGQEVIIRALEFLKEKIDNLRVYIVGDGENADRLHSLCEKLGYSDLVTFAGHLPLLRIKEIITNSDIGLVPLVSSQWADLCQPNKLFEYIAMKTPVIVSRLRAIESILDETCVMYFQPGNPEDLARCVLEIYNHPDKGRKLAEKAYNRYERIKWQKTKKLYLDIVEGLHADISGESKSYNTGLNRGKTDVG
jgi:glycosyltransferase involved in cell wall biosynthesis